MTSEKKKKGSPGTANQTPRVEINDEKEEVIMPLSVRCEETLNRGKINRETITHLNVDLLRRARTPRKAARKEALSHCKSVRAVVIYRRLE